MCAEVRSAVWARTEVCARKDGYSLDDYICYNVEMIRGHWAKCYSLEMLSGCMNVVVCLEFTIIIGLSATSQEMLSRPSLA